MAFDKKGKVEIHSPDLTKGKYLWKYIDLHKLIDFLSSKELHFTRLDLLEDPIEGLSTRNLRANNLIDLLKEEENTELINEITNKHPNISQNHDALSIFDEVKRQSQYVSCWFHDDRESMGMWNLYSNPDSVAIKVNATSFLDYIKVCGEKFIEENGNRISLICDKVKYLPLNPFDPKLPKQQIKYSSFKKDLSFKYEQEYRFLIYQNQQMTYFDNSTFYKLPIEFEEIDLEIVCHPLMLKWKRNNLEKLIKKYTNRVKISKSKIYLKKE